MPIDFTPPAEPMPSSSPNEARLPHAPRAAFYLVFHPARWTFDPSTGEYLPNLKTMSLEPGVNGIDKSGDSSLAESVRLKAGEVVIPWDRVPASVPGGRYIHRYPCKGGWYHCEVWETPRQLAGVVVDSRSDLEGRRAWLRWLVAEGHVPQISEEARELLGYRATSKLARLEGKANVGRIEAQRELVAAMAGGPPVAKARGGVK